ncbi:copper resistance CopC family protein [Corynebacterium minutissimum]|uniref:Copper resistance protein n=1 Tax=Corynebacterium minutissimum TaxID=38301 RepID=A0A2X4RLC9_9CORY|nr:copper resistance protein CopC [Corynebacterium minutissimum]KHO28516.1 copper resistance protein [Corynebacterium minutissimum]QPS59059.1 copper resistance protein CopC [Corynebacterium minutissimum]QQA80151.1 copper resistance protein CopC [Corynebacterium minutissimum]SQH99778.1 copper resistance protein [Corynebacterium minutissimum]VEG06155.1 copper resistance protein [Corynebacterium minutissimum]
MQLRQVTTALATGAIGLMLGFSAPMAVAHDSVIGGNVVSDTPLEEFPREITLEFSGIPKDTFNTFAVTDQNSGEVLFDAEPTIDGRNLTIEVPEDIDPGAGDYQVGFRITSSDGHPTPGSVQFSVASGAGDAATASSAGNADEAENGDNQADDSAAPLSALSGPAKWIVGLGAVLVVAAVVFVFGAKTRRANGDS